jgi:ribulose-5-phosphate 4-epimerase/fuculose-1-phosphate aldolase
MDTDDLTPFAPAELLADFLDGLAIMDGRGLTEGFGRLSARVAAGFVITPALAPGLATRADLFVVSPAGDPIHAPAGRRLALETPLHAAIYRARPDFGALCRTHSPAAVAWGLLGEAFLPSHGFGLMLGASVPYHRDGDLVTTAEAGDRAAATLGSARALFLKGNGLIVGGRNLREAVVRALYLEEACRATLAAGLVTPAAPFSPAERQARSQWHDAELARAWDYYSRRPSTRQPK